jgi:imidazoleglycerol phosphate dehydratase HisB
MQAPYFARVERSTKETQLELELQLHGRGEAQVATGLPFLDHLLTSLCVHSGLDLSLRCHGDLEVDDHHTAEDCALALGQAFARALGDGRGRLRFGSAYAPLDEALARAVIDLSGRPWPEIDLGLKQERLGGLSTQNVEHFLASFAIAAGASLHVDVLRGRNDHHRAEAAFKALALALRSALTWRPEAREAIPSSKGVLAGGPS